MNAFSCDCPQTFAGDLCECDLQSSTQCVGEDVTWLSSCGDLGDVAQSCLACEKCVQVSPSQAECDPLGCDVTPPYLMAVSVTPQSVNVSQSNQVVTLTFEAADDISGVSNACDGDAAFASPTGEQVATNSVCNKTLVSGTSKQGLYTLDITFPQFAQAGTWTLSSFTLKDNAGNSVDDAHVKAGLSASVNVTSIVPADPKCASASTTAMVGTGTAEDPYMVCLAEHMTLLETAPYTLDKAYALGDDLDVSTLRQRSAPERFL